MNKRKVIGILNFHWENINFGAVILNYPLAKIIQSLGYDCKIINYYFPPRKKKENSLNPKEISPHFEEFRKKYLPSRTTETTNIEDLKKINDEVDIFLVGSDQVWNSNILGEFLPIYMLEFANDNKRKISYSASFGMPEWQQHDKVEMAKNLLNRFDKISVREESAKSICKEMFGIENTTRVLDPTLLLKAEDYDELIEKEEIKTPSQKYVALSFLKNDSNIDIVKNAAQQKYPYEQKEITHTTQHIFAIRPMKSSLKDIIKLSECLISFKFGRAKKFLKNLNPFKEVLYSNRIAEWLNYIKNAEFIITDSFHCTIFSIIYKKQFICIDDGWLKGRLDRFYSLFDLLGINKNRIVKIADFNPAILNENIGYEDIDNIIEREKN